MTPDEEAFGDFLIEFLGPTDATEHKIKMLWCGLSGECWRRATWLGATAEGLRMGRRFTTGRIEFGPTTGTTPMPDIKIHSMVLAEDLVMRYLVMRYRLALERQRQEGEGGLRMSAARTL